MPPSDLHAQLLEAHARGETKELAGLYEAAADQAQTEEARGFFLTQAFVFALDAGTARAAILRQKLVELGREDLR
ncbi:MAG: hypothetical protein AAF700_02235 [Pseudomonadota bacterium]